MSTRVQGLQGVEGAPVDPGLKLWPQLFDRALMAVSRLGRLRFVPWIVLAVALGVTAGAAGLRAGAVADDRDRALAAADGHFRDVVADNEHRGRVVSQAYERALVGSMRGLASPVSPTNVAEGLDDMAADDLAGAAGFVVMPNGAEPTWIGDEAVVDLRQGTVGEPGLWVSASVVDDESALVGYTTATGDVIAVVVVTEELLALSMTEDDGHNHSVSARLLPLSFSKDTPLVLGVDPQHDMGNHSQQHEAAGHRDQGPVSLRATREVVMFEQPWALVVTASDDFLTIPSSREVAILAGLGVMLSVALFGLIYFLVRRVLAEEQARAATERFASAFNYSPIGAVVLDATGEIVEVNSALEELLGSSADELNGTTMADIVSEPLRSDWSARILRPDSKPELRTRTEVRYDLSSDRSLWVDETATPVVSDGGERHILLQVSDVTEQRRAREELQRRTLHDELTGLPNRTLLEDRLSQTLRRIRRDRSIAAVMFMDVDQFKNTNDTLGHGAGDRLLAELADRLAAVTREHDTIARFGGDEFVMLCENLVSPTDVWQIADHIRSQVNRPFELDGRPTSTTISIGIAICGPDDRAEAVLRDADLAMYQAKELGRNRAVLFERGMRDHLIEQLALEDQLVRAIDHDQFELYYQPLITTDGGRLQGFEALIRWNHPDRGVLAPDAFLPAASHLGLLPAIDAWVLATAAEQLVSWVETIPAATEWTVAVNASPANFGDPDFPARVTRTVAEAGADPSHLTIEITEEAILANTDTAVEIIRQLRQAGFRIAIDDFGTGYSSLSQLANLDIDILKIDKSFMVDLHNSPSNEIVRAVVDMARALGIPTVAEGVETQSDLDALREMGATQAQGYLISRPVPAAQAQALTIVSSPVPA